jgi:hypothetical protein
VFYEQRDGTPSKAILVEHLQDLFASGVISERTKVWKDGWADWRKLGACKELLTLVDVGDGAAAHDKTCGDSHSPSLFSATEAAYASIAPESRIPTERARTMTSPCRDYTSRGSLPRDKKQFKNRARQKASAW